MSEPVSECVCVCVCVCANECVFSETEDRRSEEERRGKNEILMKRDVGRSFSGLCMYLIFLLFGQAFFLAWMSFHIWIPRFAGLCCAAA